MEKIIAQNPKAGRGACKQNHSCRIPNLVSHMAQHGWKPRSACELLSVYADSLTTDTPEALAASCTSAVAAGTVGADTDAGAVRECVMAVQRWTSGLAVGRYG